MNIKKQFEEGLLSKNPVLAQLLGMCMGLFDLNIHYYKEC